jgi:hypothetical protein
MVHTQSLSLQPRNGHSVPFIQLRQSFPSKVMSISPFVDQLIRFILKFRQADGRGLFRGTWRGSDDAKEI